MRKEPVYRVIIVRHGESSYNLEKRIQGRSDRSQLTERGESQADLVRDALQGLEFRRVYASPLQRAYRTAQRIRGSQESLSTSDRLREINLPDWEGMTFAEVEAQFPTDYRLWRSDPQALVMQDVRPVEELWQQAKEFWSLLKQEAGSDLADGSVINLLIVGHNGINQALIALALGIDSSAYHRLGQDNCAISVLNFPQGLAQPAQLESLNITAHLGDPLPKSKGGIRLLLVRHGETDWNRDQRFQGQKDIPLNSSGEKQAGLVADFLAYTTLDLAFSSPLKRPWETANAILSQHSHLSLQSIPDLQEICHGEWEGKLQAEIEADYPGLLQQWQIAPETVQMPCGETLQQVWQRSWSAWQEILQIAQAHGSATTSLVVAHDAVNKAILCQLFGLDPVAFWAFKQGNGAVTVIDYPEGIERRAVLKAMNISVHLEGGILDCTAAGAL